MGSDSDRKRSRRNGLRNVRFVIVAGRSRVIALAFSLLFASVSRKRKKKVAYVQPYYFFIPVTKTLLNMNEPLHSFVVSAQSSLSRFF